MQFFHIFNIIESRHLHVKCKHMNNNMKILKFILLILFTLINTSCFAAKNTQNKHLAYITNQGENSVSVIDTLRSTQVIQTVEVGRAPVGVAASAKLKRVYISNVESQDISVIDTKNNTVIETIKINGSPVGLALSPDSKNLICCQIGLKIVYSPSAQTVATPMREAKVGDAPAGLVASQNGKWLYIANRDSNDIAVIETAYANC